jgi:hypothetical protein
MRLTINSETTLQAAIGEEWRDIPGLEGAYQASSLGRIRSMTRRGRTCYGATRMLQGHVLTTSGGKRGYVRVPPNIADTQFVHRLVAMAFIPNPKRLPVVNHKDGNKANNRPENLEWCTQGENVRHAFSTGLATKQRPGKGGLSPAAKLTEAQVIEIKKRIATGHRSIDLAAEYGVAKGTIGEIKAGRSWGHVQCD